MTTITIDRSRLEQAIDALAGYRQELDDSQPCDAEQALSAAIAAQQPAPAWHDAPTVPGLWVSDTGGILVALRIPPDLLDRVYWIAPDRRWCGPFPEDTK